MSVDELDPALSVLLEQLDRPALLELERALPMSLSLSGGGRSARPNIREHELAALA